MSPEPRFVSYAQHGEDVVLWRALGDRHGVFYVDVGAFHPSHDSVTRALYERGWRGVNIEPQPDRLKAFEKERPEDVNLQLAIGDDDGETVLNLPDNPGWASILDPAEMGTHGEDARAIQVTLRRLDTLLSELGIEHVDVLKVDVEGAEPAVIRGLLQGPVRPLVCVIEGVAPGVGRAAGDEAVRLLVDAGYAHCMFDGLNHYLTIEPALVPALSVPANPVDGYATDLVERLMKERLQLHETIAWLATENLELRTPGGDAAPTDATATIQPVAPDIDPDAQPASQQDETQQDDAQLADTIPDSVGSDLPLPATEAPDVTTTLDEDAVPLEPAAVLIDGDLRAQRRRTTFATLLRGGPAPLAEPAGSSLGRLLRLALADHTPADAVTVLYREILGREVEPEGLASWTSHLENGLPVLAVAHALAESPEALDHPSADQARVQAHLAAWEALVAVTELGVAAWRPSRTYTPGRVAHEVFVEALFEVALQRRPDPAELATEVDKLAGGAGRAWLMRSYAARPETRERFLGRRRSGGRARVRRLLDAKAYRAAFRELVAIAEARQVNQLLASLTGVSPSDISETPTTPGREV